MGEVRAPDELLADLLSDDPATAARALRDVLAVQLVTAGDASKAAAVGKVLAEVQKNLAELKPAEGSAVDDLASRRSKRRAAIPDGAAVGDDSGGGRSGRARGKRGSGP